MEPSSDESKPFPFLNLPPEIRNQVYSELFSVPIPKKEYADGSTKYIFDLQLLRTSQQIYQEANEVFRQRNLFVSIETPWSQAEGFVVRGGGVPLVANETAAESFGPCHLRAIIDSPDVEVSTTSKFIISIDDLEAFCWIWFYSNLSYLDMNRHLSLKLVVNNLHSPGSPLPATTQKRLTRPFGLVKNLSRFELIGDVNGDTEAALRKEQSVPFDSPLQCLNNSLVLLEAGDAELKAGKHHEALATYIKAFFAIHVVVDGRNRWVHARDFFRQKLPSPMFGSYNAEYVHVTMRIKLVASTMLAFLKLENWEEAHFWGMRSITLCRQELGDGAETPGHVSFPAPREWGKIYHRTAIASEEMGDWVQAREMYRIATAWLPGDIAVVKALRRISRLSD